MSSKHDAMLAAISRAIKKLGTERDVSAIDQHEHRMQAAFHSAVQETTIFSFTESNKCGKVRISNGQ